MGFYRSYILPRIIEAGGGQKAVAVERKQCLAGVTGTVLEVGFGTGHNLPYYPSGVVKLVGVDPCGASAKFAKRRIEQAPFPVELIHKSMEEIDLSAATFDSVVCTYSLCTIPDPAAALARMNRALKPGGRFFFLEHGRSNEPKISRWQDRLNGIQNWLFGGCNVNREIDHLIAGAGFAIDTIDRYYAKTGPKALAFMYRGVAHRGA